MRAGVDVMSDYCDIVTQCHQSPALTPDNTHNSFRALGLMKID